jgi:NurA-like 5'-3' nuclease
MNTLRSVFWEYPELTDEQQLRRMLKQCRAAADEKLYRWIMRRFLEYGRAVDALRFFSIEEIVANLDKLQLSAYALRKWRRLGEVYHAP